MIPIAFEYQRAASIDEAIQLLREANGSGRLLAGGHSLIPLMKLRLSEPSLLIDIARIPGLRGIEETSDHIAIGATTTHTEVERSALLRERLPILAEAAAEIGDVQVRNRGTIGGSLAHADPSADLPAVMVALDAELVIAGSGGQRTVRAGEFFQDLFTVDLAEDEIITMIHATPVQTAAYVKLHQRASHYAIVGVAAVLEVENGVCTSARLGITGLSTHAQRLPKVEEALAGKPLTADTITAAAAIAGDGIDDINADIHASADYRRAMAKAFTERAITAAAVPRSQPRSPLNRGPWKVEA